MRIGPTGAHRLVCVADSDAKVVIFGREWERENINAVLEAGLPCIVRCETHPASRSVRRVFGHTHWVWEYSMLEIAHPQLDEESAGYEPDAMKRSTSSIDGTRSKAILRPV